MLAAEKIPAAPAWTNDPVIRIGAAAAPMKRLDSAGNPGFLVGPKCKVLRKALSGGYKYRRIKVAGDERYHDVPDKNRYSHPADGFQYLMLSLGEGTSLISSNSSPTKINYNNDGII